MQKEQTTTEFQFLSGGGEMGKLTRQKDWSKTSVGDPSGWPQSLRTTISIILLTPMTPASSVPMPTYPWWPCRRLLAGDHAHYSSFDR